MEDIPFEETNMFNFGTELELKVKKAAAEHEEEWKTVDNNPGVSIWRIEKFHVKKWPKEYYGKFYDGDSYIILISTLNSEGVLHREAHMWVGNKTTADESGTAAYKVVELDNFFDRKITLVWNGQGNESDSLKKAFKSIKILKGGIESGFKKVEKEVRETCLFEIYNERIIQVDIDADSLTSYNTFVLDSNDVIYLWRGKKSSKKENFNAAMLVNELKEHRGKIEFLDISQDEEDDRFWNLLGGKKPIKETLKSTKRHSLIKDKRVMFKISDESGNLKMDSIDFEKKNLDSNDVFMIQNQDNLVLWIGKEASRKEKFDCMILANKYVKENGFGKSIKIFVINDGNESHILENMF